MTFISRKIIEIFYTESGGGHFSVANSLKEQVEKYYPGYEVHLIDGLRQSNISYHRYLDLYPKLVNYARWIYDLYYESTNSYFQTQFIKHFLRVFFSCEVEQYLIGKDVDLFISCHPIFTLLMPDLVHTKTNAKFVSIITDPITPHVHNFSSDVDMCIVASESSKKIAIKQGLAPYKIKVIGHPVSNAFFDKKNKIDLCKGLGLIENKFNVLIVGGGDGMGKIYDTVLTLLETDMPIQLLVVCGRNRDVYSKISEIKTTKIIKIFGFVNNLADLMCVSDIIITKPGPSTIYESFASGLPILIYDAKLGQEIGNISLIVENDAGRLCNNSNEVAETVSWLYNDVDSLRRMARKSQALSKKNVAYNIIKECLSLL